MPRKHHVIFKSNTLFHFASHKISSMLTLRILIIWGICATWLYLYGKFILFDFIYIEKPIFARLNLMTMILISLVQNVVIRHLCNKCYREPKIYFIKLQFIDLFSLSIKSENFMRNEKIKTSHCTSFTGYTYRIRKIYVRNFIEVKLLTGL